MEIRILLFVQEGRARQKYIDALTACGVQVFVTSSFHDLSPEICSQTYHGLFLDLPTKMKAIRENKAYVYHLVENFPVSHLQQDDKTDEIRCFHFNRKYGSTLMDFINSQCRHFIPQKIRTDARTTINLHVLVYKKNCRRPERSATKDLSPGGCFIFSTRRWYEGTDILIHFNDMKNISPVHAQIRSVIKWGENRQIPGIGVRFQNLTDMQTAELAKFFGSKDET